MKLNPNDREPINEKCQGCRRAEAITIKGEEKEVCKLYLYPDKKWLYGICSGVDNEEVISNEQYGKKRFGQQKQKKIKR